MKRIKKSDERKVRISITISPLINDIVVSKSENKSNFIESILYEYFKNNNLDVSKIKI